MQFYPDVGLQGGNYCPAHCCYPPDCDFMYFICCQVWIKLSSLIFQKSHSGTHRDLRTLVCFVNRIRPVDPVILLVVMSKPNSLKEEQGCFSVCVKHPIVQNAHL